MADNSQLLQNEVPPANEFHQDGMPSAFKTVDLDNGPPAYNTVGTYPQHQGNNVISTVTTQPPAAMADNVVIAQPQHQERPSHGLAIGSLIFAVMTLICSGGVAIFCAVPAIVLSAMALGQDYKVDNAKTMSLISLALSAVYWILAVIVVIVVVILVVVEANKCIDYGCDFPEIPDYRHDFNSYNFG